MVFLSLVLTETKMRLGAKIRDLECGHIKRPELLNPIIEDNTKGCEIFQIQEDHKVNRQDYICQYVIDDMAVEAIFAAVDSQYVEQLEEDCVGYKNQNIRTMVEQFQTWYVITTKEKIAIQAHFLEPWSNTPDAHITTFSRQLDRRQVKCEDRRITVTEAYNLDHIILHMYACDLFERKKLENWEESDNKS